MLFNVMTVISEGKSRQLAFDTKAETLHKEHM